MIKFLKVKVKILNFKYANNIGTETIINPSKKFYS